MGPLQSSVQCFNRREVVVAIHNVARQPCTDGFLGDGFGATLQAAGGGNRPLVVDHHKHHRQVPGTGQVDALQKVTLGGTAIANAAHHRPLLVANFNGRGHTHGMAALGGNGYRYGQVFRAILPGAAALVAAPVQQQLPEADTTQNMGSLVPVVRHKHIRLRHALANGRAHHFVPQHRRIGTAFSGTLQGNGFGIEGAGQHHVAVGGQNPVGVPGLGRQLTQGLAVIIQIAGAIHIKLVDFFHPILLSPGFAIKTWLH